MELWTINFYILIYIQKKTFNNYAQNSYKTIYIYDIIALLIDILNLNNNNHNLVFIFINLEDKKS